MRVTSFNVKKYICKLYWNEFKHEPTLQSAICVAGQ